MEMPLLLKAQISRLVRENETLRNDRSCIDVLFPSIDETMSSSLRAPDPESGPTGRPRRKSSRASRPSFAEDDAGEDGEDDAFGDDFDDFEEGGEDDDFDDFEDGFQEAEPIEQNASPAQQTTLPFVRPHVMSKRH